MLVKDRIKVFMLYSLVVAVIFTLTYLLLGSVIFKENNCGQVDRSIVPSGYYYSLSLVSPELQHTMYQYAVAYKCENKRKTAVANGEAIVGVCTLVKTIVV